MTDRVLGTHTLFAVYQAIHTLIGRRHRATGIPPEKISFPHPLAAATDTVTAGFPPHQLDLALATFLLKILDSTRSSATAPTGRAPGPPRRPATSPPGKDRPSVVRVHRRLQIHCLRPNSPLVIT